MAWRDTCFAPALHTCTSAVVVSHRLCNDNCSAAALPAMQQTLCLMAPASGPAHLQCSSGSLGGWCTMQEQLLRLRGRTHIMVTVHLIV